MYYDYPELYYRIYPKVISAVNEHLDENYSMENITKEQMEKMVDDIYIKMVHECPEIHEDPYERRYRGRVRGEQRYQTIIADTNKKMEETKCINAL